MITTPLQVLAKVETEVHEEFKEQAPSKEQVLDFLEKKYDPAIVGLVAASATLAFIAFLKANGITLAVVATWILEAWGRWRIPRCPEPNCGRTQVTVDQTTGESVCSQGHRWRP